MKTNKQRFQEITNCYSSDFKKQLLAFSGWCMKHHLDWSMGNVDMTPYSFFTVAPTTHNMWFIELEGLDIEDAMHTILVAAHSNVTHPEAYVHRAERRHEEIRVKYVDDKNKVVQLNDFRKG